MANIDQFQFKRFQFLTEKYNAQLERWPKEGKHILAQYTDEYVIVYQAFNQAIADYAVKNQRFGGPAYKTTRMTWIKPNFLWMMYRSEWSKKDKNQERILALYLSREGFEEILKNAYTTNLEKEESIPRDDVKVRLQWDPDHDPLGQSVTRRAMQLGVKPNIVGTFNDKWILHIRDVTDFAKQQHRFVLQNKLDDLVCPKETVYKPSNENISRRVELD